MKRAETSEVKSKPTLKSPIATSPTDGRSPTLHHRIQLRTTLLSDVVLPLETPKKNDDVHATIKKRSQPKHAHSLYLIFQLQNTLLAPLPFPLILLLRSL